VSNKHTLASYLGVSLAVAVWLCVQLPGTASAAPTPRSSATPIRVSPALLDLQVTPGETSTTITETVTNLTKSTLTITLNARDFEASPEGGSYISFYDNSYNQVTNPHTLQSTIGFVSPTVSVTPQASKKIVITLNSLDQLAPGGHYGAILFRPESRVSGNTKEVSIRSAIASLIFLKTASGGTQTLSLLPFSVNFLRFTLPANNYIVFNNVGNTQAAPVGQLSLYGPTGSLLSTTVLNPGSGLILPGSSRLFTITLPLHRTLFAWPGMYRLKLQYRNSSQTTFTTVTKRFLFINLPLLIAVLCICAAILYLLRMYGGRILRSITRAGKWLKQIFVKKPPPPPPAPPKPKRPRLVQG
jgi:hypothetical protein